MIKVLRITMMVSYALFASGQYKDRLAHVVGMIKDYATELGLEVAFDVSSQVTLVNQPYSPQFATDLVVLDAESDQFIISSRYLKAVGIRVVGGASFVTIGEVSLGDHNTLWVWVCKARVEVDDILIQRWALESKS